MTDQQTLRSEAPGNSSPATTDLWRKEIHARVSGYRTRRGRRVEGAFSMRFPFPPLEPGLSAPPTVVPEDLPHQEPIVVDAGAMTAVLTSVAEVAVPELCVVGPQPLASGPSAPAPAPEVSPTQAPALQKLPDAPPPPAPPELRLDPQPLPVPLPRPRPQRKVIAFPRQAPGAPEMFHRLADPVLPDQPRILDVPEELEALPTTPFLDGLQFGPSAQPVVATQTDNVELPFRAVSRARRTYAASLDGLLVAAAAALCAAVGHRILPTLVLTKPLLLTAAALPVLLWAIYQYLLLVYGGATAGMQVARIRLSTFKGNPPRRRERRHRVIALYFSTASLVMGLLWALVDVDTLCWHDRISRTYLTDRE
jgi:uncharacterized RDD family membrane protein YckC